MNPEPAGGPRPVELVDIIDFKWLMAHDGHHVHVERLQADAAYAGECLALAALSSCPALRDASQRMRLLLGLEPAPPLPPDRTADTRAGRRGG